MGKRERRRTRQLKKVRTQRKHGKIAGRHGKVALEDQHRDRAGSRPFVEYKASQSILVVGDGGNICRIWLAERTYPMLNSARCWCLHDFVQNCICRLQLFAWLTAALQIRRQLDMYVVGWPHKTGGSISQSTSVFGGVACGWSTSHAWRGCH